MKKLSILFITLTFSIITSASQLFLLPTGSLEQTKNAFSLNHITIHFYNDHFVIGSTDGQAPDKSFVLDAYAWNDPEMHYFLLYFDPENRVEYLALVGKVAEILYQSTDFLVVATDEKQASDLFPAVHGGMIGISKTAATFPQRSINYKPGSLQFRDEISELIAQVNIDTLQAYVQHLQDFGTRNAYKSGGIAAQNWILAKFQSYGMDVELHDFSMPSGPASDNVIATITGTEYPDEYIVLGAHYDSYAGGPNEPGADDNATGTAGILEAARIMSQLTFDRSIIFATWSGEEYGLYGSDAWASEAAQDGLNILGYFNIDMAGYLAPGDVVHTDIIGPSSANELKQYYKDVCAIYLPDFQTFNGALSGGDSDHTSFNNNGYQGIFPFEDSQNYSPFIHTANDVIGTSVNNFGQHMTFVQATVANVASMASQYPTPENLVAVAGDLQVDLAWDPVQEEIINYNIYRNGEPEPYAISVEPSYTDTDVVNGSSYTYYVTAIFQESGDESGPSNPVTVIPMPPIALPFFDDFETGGPYWTMENTWGLVEGVYHSSAYSLTESPEGFYTANMDASVILRALNFTGATSATLSFWTRYSIESDYDYTYLEISTDGSEWEQLDYFTGNQYSWIQKSYSLDNYLGQPNVIIRFRFTSDIYVEAQGMNIDDLEVNVNGVGIDNELISGKASNLEIRPNPARNKTYLNYFVEEGSQVKLTLYSSAGQEMMVITNLWAESGNHQYEFDITDLPDGIYFITLFQNDIKTTRKLVISR